MVFPGAIAWYTEAGMGCPCLLPSLRMFQEKGFRILTLESAGCYKQELGWPSQGPDVSFRSWFFGSPGTSDFHAAANSTRSRWC